TSDTFVAVAPPAPPPPPGPVMPSSGEPRHAAEMPVAVPRAATLPGAPPPTPVGGSRTTTRPGTAPAPVPAPRLWPSTPPAGTARDGATRDGAISETLSAVPTPSATPGSAPTEIGGVLVEALPASDPAIAIVPA